MCKSNFSHRCAALKARRSIIAVRLDKIEKCTSISAEQRDQIVAEIDAEDERLFNEIADLDAAAQNFLQRK
jgi:hypothetical protein